MLGGFLEILMDSFSKCIFEKYELIGSKVGIWLAVERSWRASYEFSWCEDIVDGGFSGSPSSGWDGF